MQSTICIKLGKQLPSPRLSLLNCLTNMAVTTPGAYEFVSERIAFVNILDDSHLSVIQE